MKKMIIVLTLFFFVSGCLNHGADETIVNEWKYSTFIREVQLTKKKELDLYWTLVDGRTNEVIQIVRLPELGYKRGFGFEEEKLVELAKSLAKDIDRPLVNPTITRDGELKEGQKRVILSEKELVNTMMSLAYYNKELYLPIYEEKPTVTKEQLAFIKERRLSSFTTYFNPNITGRSKNIYLSSKAIDHHVIGSNEIFSFNQVVGQRTKERGYQEAKEIVNKEFVMGIGGGVCQTSSTLFNAIDKVGLEIIERHSHSRDIGYVPPKLDAAVSWGGPDFKFRNPYAYPILISTETNLETGVIEIRVYASKKLELLVAATP